MKNNKNIKKWVKNTLLTVIVFLLLLSPFALAFSAAFLLPAQFEADFEGALGKKFERLTSIAEDKIVVVGGSSVAFGLDSELLEKEMGMPVVNFGLYAALGTKLMLDLSLAGISEGDTVVLAPELDEQTLSMYFSAHHTLIALESCPEMIKYIPNDNKYSLLGGLWKFGSEKIGRLLDGTPRPEGVYNSENINSYGDLEYAREENVMFEYYNPEKPILLSESIVSPDFLEYLNDYIKKCKDLGARVVFSYPPMNALAVSEEGDPFEFEKYLIDNLDCDVISFIDDYIIEPGYFYDTNFHLNDAGVALRTRQLAIDLGSETAANTKRPEAPSLPVRDSAFSGEDENDKYFVFKTLSNGAKSIVGLTEEGKRQESLTVPLGTEGRKVTVLDTGIFAGSNVKKLVITEDTNIRLFTGAGFGSSDVKDVYIYYDSGGSESEAISPIRDFGGVKIHVRAGVLWPTTYLWTDTVDHSTVTFVYDLE